MICGPQYSKMSFFLSSLSLEEREKKIRNTWDRRCTALDTSFLRNETWAPQEENETKKEQLFVNMSCCKKRWLQESTNWWFGVMDVQARGCGNRHLGSAGRKKWDASRLGDAVLSDGRSPRSCNQVYSPCLDSPPGLLFRDSRFSWATGAGTWQCWFWPIQKIVLALVEELIVPGWHVFYSLQERNGFFLFCFCFEELIFVAL
jgi:hypothetical protein